MRIKEIDLHNEYSYFWLKYVTGFNLNNHCAKSLIGNYSSYINTDIVKNRFQGDLLLDEYNYNYIYICGVTKPYKWQNNLHLALEDSKGEYVDFQFNGERIIIEDARQIPIYRQLIYNHPKAKYKSYNTCRNWQFAYQQLYNI